MERTPTSTNLNKLWIGRAINLLSPRWTIWTLNNFHLWGSMSPKQLHSEMPWLSATNIHQILSRMCSSGLLRSPERSRYEVSRLGLQTPSAIEALSSWYTQNKMPYVATYDVSERAEACLSMLVPRGAVEVLNLLQQGPMRAGALSEAANLSSGSFNYRMKQLIGDGLVVRDESDRRHPYVLTSAARELKPIYVQLHHLGRAGSMPNARGRGSGQTDVASRARAANLRSGPPPAMPPVLFSDSPNLHSRSAEQIHANRRK